VVEEEEDGVEEEEDGASIVVALGLLSLGTTLYQRRRRQSL
jgi:hypothetical protein